MNIIVTGGAGFLGSEIAAFLARSGHEVWSYDHYVIEHEVERDGVRYMATPGDVLDVPHLYKVVARVRPEVVIHAAAIVGPPASIVRPALVTNVNINGSVNVFEAALMFGVRRVVDISSEEIYGPFAAPEIDEDHPKAPNSPYGVTKLTVEMLAGQYIEHFGLDYVAARVCWAFGARYPRVRPPQSWLKDAIAGRHTVVPNGGDHRIDLTYVDDVAEGIRLLAEATTLQHRAYHITSGTAQTMRELAEAVKELMPDWTYEMGPGFIEMGPGFTAAPKGAMSNARARDELGFVPQFSLADGLRRNLEDLLAQG
jgi:nucleoside-diphosphate-sugar epimerase